MSTKADELKLDIEEFNKLLQQATRQRTKDVLDVEVRRLQTALAKLIEENTSASTKSTNAITSNSTNKCYEVKLNNYGWDQTNTTLKLYVILQDVHQLPKEAVTCNFTEKSVDLRILGLNNRNYSLTIKNLCESIDVNKSDVKVKTDIVVVSLAKKIPKQWSYVTGVEKKIKESKSFPVPDMGDDSDPSASVMKVMKKMYQEGDDEVKKAMAKAWTKSQEMKGADTPDYFKFLDS